MTNPVQETQATDRAAADISVGLLDARVLLLLAVVLTPVVIFWPTALEIFLVWIRSDTFAHGILIFPLALYLLVERREILSRHVPQPALLGAVLLVGLAVFWYLGVLASVDVAQQLAVALMMSAGVLTVFGWAITRRLAFPLLYLLFAVPIGEFMILPLMKWTAEFTVFALQLTGIPVYREGMFFRIPSGNFEVAKACSGIRYLIASVALGVVFANLYLRTTSRRLIFVAISVLVPVLANGLRAYGIVMLAHLSGMTLAVGVDHIIYGWLFFGFVMFVMFAFGWWLRRGEGSQRTDTSGPESGLVSTSHYLKTATVSAMAAIVLIMITPLVVLATSTSSYSGAGTTLPVPSGVGDWAGPLPDAESHWAPEFSDAFASGQARYSWRAGTVSVFVAAYDPANRESEMVSWKNQFYPEPWTAITQQRQQVSAAGSAWQVEEVLAIRAGKRQLIWYWYETDLGKTPSNVLAKVAETLAALPGRKDMPRALALATAANEDVTESRQILTQFLEQMYPHIRECVHAVGMQLHSGSGQLPGTGCSNENLR